MYYRKLISFFCFPDNNCLVLRINWKGEFVTHFLIDAYPSDLLLPEGEQGQYSSNLQDATLNYIERLANYIHVIS